MSCRIRVQKKTEGRTRYTKMFSIALRESTYRALEQCALELEMKPPELVRCILRIMERRNLWRETLRLDGQPDEIDA